MLRTIKKLIPRPLVKVYHFLLAVFALLRYGNPSKDLVVIGVTGTDGKTTTSYLLYQIMKEAGLPVSQITSVGIDMYSDDEETAPSGFHVTTPGPLHTQSLLAEAKRVGSKYVILETTSHGLDQFRVYGVKYHIGVVTNVTREHLDYHKAWEEYVKAKAKLLRDVDFSIINKDDSSYKPMLKRATGKVISYGMKTDADVIAENVVMSPGHVSFDVPYIHSTVESVFVGEYNVQNVLGAITAAKALGIEDKVIVRALKKASAPPGRLELIDDGQDFTVIIDFAHTANGLDSVLKMLNHVKEKNLIVVFGSAGERDYEKRRPMGVSAGKYCDLVVITAEDPRTEDLQMICETIAEGCESEGKVKDESYFIIHDRAKAIHYAITELAQPGDIVVTTGKAHEQSMNYDGIHEEPWNEFEAVHTAIADRLKKDKSKA